MCQARLSNEDPKKSELVHREENSFVTAGVPGKEFKEKHRTGNECVTRAFILALTLLCSLVFVNGYTVPSGVRKVVRKVSTKELYTKGDTKTQAAARQVQNYNRYDVESHTSIGKFGFKSSVELVNGRLAMAGLGVGLATEALTSKSIWEQVNIADHMEQKVVAGLGLISIINVVKRSLLFRDQSVVG